jgi:hypothetical protein
MQLSISGSLIEAAEGRQLDGNDDGQPRGAYVTLLNSHGAIGAAVPSARTRRISAKAIDALLVDGQIDITTIIHPGHLHSRM